MPCCAGGRVTLRSAEPARVACHVPPRTGLHGVLDSVTPGPILEVYLLCNAEGDALRR